jgi:hypothetical protein
MTDNTDILIKEYQDKLVYYYKRIDEVNEQMKIIQSLTCKHINKHTGQGVLPKGWNNNE